jgi:hypothetical protein
MTNQVNDQMAREVAEAVAEALKNTGFETYIPKYQGYKVMSVQLWLNSGREISVNEIWQALEFQVPRQYITYTVRDGIMEIETLKMMVDGLSAHMTDVGFETVKY